VNPIHRKELLEALGMPHKPPIYACTDYTKVVLQGRYGHHAGPIWARLQGPAGTSRGHRLLVRCPTCDREVPAGRIAQHHKVHDKEARKELAVHQLVMRQASYAAALHKAGQAEDAWRNLKLASQMATNDVQKASALVIALNAGMDRERAMAIC
jgi:hypothetical protein